LGFHHVPVERSPTAFGVAGDTIATDAGYERAGHFASSPR
jgi:hypothetical protein